MGLSPSLEICSRRKGVRFIYSYLISAGHVLTSTEQTNKRVGDCYPMAKLLNLRNVPDDEADDVRAMLDAARIAFYETPPSIWGISAGGIYVKENADVAEAKRLMADYQAQRRSRVRAEREAAVRDGNAETFWTVLRAEPLRVVLTVIAIVFLLGLVALPMFLLRGG